MKTFIRNSPVALALLLISSMAIGGDKAKSDDKDKADDKKNDEKKGEVGNSDEEEQFTKSEDVKKYKKWKEEHDRKSKAEKAAKLKATMAVASQYDREHAREHYDFEVTMNVRTMSREMHTVRSAKGPQVYNRGIVLRSVNTSPSVDGTDNENAGSQLHKNYWIRLYTAMKSEQGGKMLDQCSALVDKSMESPDGEIIIRGTNILRNALVVTHHELVRSFGWEWFLFKYVGVGDRPDTPMRKFGKIIDDMFKIRAGMTLNLDSGYVSCEAK